MSLFLGSGTAGFLFMAGIFWFGKKKSSEEEPSVKTVTAEEFMRSPKTALPLKGTVNVGSEVYIVEGRLKYCEIEDGEGEDETLISDEDYWWVLTLSCDVEDQDYFLSCEQGEDDHWEFWFCEDITDKILALNAFEGVSYHDENGAPPESFEYRGKTYEVEPDDHDETYFVVAEHQFRKSEDEYFVQVTSYIERLGRRASRYESRRPT